jgi:hypothetical protein
MRDEAVRQLDKFSVFDLINKSGFKIEFYEYANYYDNIYRLGHQRDINFAHAGWVGMKSMVENGKWKKLTRHLYSDCNILTTIVTPIIPPKHKVILLFLYNQVALINRKSW